MRKHVLVDVDGVLADIHNPILRAIRQALGRKMALEDFDQWDLFADFKQEERKSIFKVLEEPGFCRQFKPVEGATEAITELRGFVDVTVVTQPFPSPTWVWDRTWWLIHVFGFHEMEIIHTAAKHRVSGDMFLDDNPENVAKWMRHHPTGVGLVWHTPVTHTLTQYDHLRVMDWDEVLRKVRAL
jgi:5'(3')-deoxyribonucleotidase